MAAVLHLNWCHAQVLSLLENAKLGHPLPGPAGSFSSLPSLGMALSQVALRSLVATAMETVIAPDPVAGVVHRT